MRKWIAASIVGASLSVASAALPCGGGFGLGLEIDPAQDIVVRYENGVETYTFSPHFCGEAADFGLVLPVPDVLTANPALGKTTLVPELADLTKPTVEKVTKCKDWSDGQGGGFSGGTGNSPDAGATVISKGQVGIFDWVLLKADTAQAFTDWLDANKFPHGPNANAPFDAYVQAGWHFVAFKVTADTQAPPPGTRLCGELGPIELAFNAQRPVVPARIAAATSGSASGTPSWSATKWRVYLLANGEGSLSSASTTFAINPMFSGALSSADLSAHPTVAAMSTPGDRLTAMEVAFYPESVDGDIELDFSATPTDFRWTKQDITWVDCDAGAGGGGAGTGGGTGATGAGASGGSGGASAGSSDGGCAVSHGAGEGAATLGWLAVLGAIAARLRRRR